MQLGSHLSVAGGLEKALLSAAEYGFPCVALFARSPRQWKAPPLTEAQIKTFKRTRRETGIRTIVAHASYLYNLAGQPEVRKKSIRALGDELLRCANLGIEYLVLHPGSNPDPEEGVRLIADGLDQAMDRVPRRRVKLLIEGMAGQGNTLGHRFEHLRDILRGVHLRRRFGVCLDTCHLFAAGYDLRSLDGWQATMESFDKLVGLKHLHVWHLNDSLRERGAHRDRHEHIGKGKIGRKGFRNLVNDPRFRDTPMILETPKGPRESDGKDWDRVNAGILRRLQERDYRP